MKQHKKILITGSEGFIGKELSKKLLDEGNEVFCVDILNGYDLKDKNEVDKLPEVDIVIHLAAYNGTKWFYDKPYDVCPIDWVEAFLKKDPNPQKTSRFWCSALVGYIYTKCGILDPSTDWSILSPSDFSIEGQNLTFCEGMSLSNTQTKLF